MFLNPSGNSGSTAGLSVFTFTAAANSNAGGVWSNASGHYREWQNTAHPIDQYIQCNSIDYETSQNGGMPSVKGVPLLGLFTVNYGGNQRLAFAMANSDGNNPGLAAGYMTRIVIEDNVGGVTRADVTFTDSDLVELRSDPDTLNIIVVIDLPSAGSGNLTLVPDTAYDVEITEKSGAIESFASNAFYLTEATGVDPFTGNTIRGYYQGVCGTTTGGLIQGKQVFAYCRDTTAGETLVALKPAGLAEDFMTRAQNHIQWPDPAIGAVDTGQYEPWEFVRNDVANGCTWWRAVGGKGWVTNHRLIAGAGEIFVPPPATNDVYFDSNSASPTEDGTAANPYKTFAAWTRNFQSNQRLYFKRGGEYYLESDGAGDWMALDLPYVTNWGMIGYGDVTKPYPKIYGSKVEDTWTASGSAWYIPGYTDGGGDVCGVVTYDDMSDEGSSWIVAPSEKPLKWREFTTVGAIQPGEYSWDRTINRMYIRLPDDSDPNLPTYKIRVARYRRTFGHPGGGAQADMERAYTSLRGFANNTGNHRNVRAWVHHNFDYCCGGNFQNGNWIGGGPQFEGGTGGSICEDNYVCEVWDAPISPQVFGTGSGDVIDGLIIRRNFLWNFAFGGVELSVWNGTAAAPNIIRNLQIYDNVIWGGGAGFSALAGRTADNNGGMRLSNPQSGDAQNNRADNIEIFDNIIYDVEGYGINWRNYKSTTGLKIYRNKIYNCAFDGIYMRRDNTGVANDTGDPEIFLNLVYDCGLGGISRQSSKQDNSLFIYKNTVMNCPTAFREVTGGTDPTGSTIIEDNIAYHHTQTGTLGVAGRNALTFVRNNTIYGYATDIEGTATTQSGNTNYDPLFADYPTDLHPIGPSRPGESAVGWGSGNNFPLDDYNGDPYVTDDTGAFAGEVGAAPIVWNPKPGHWVQVQIADANSVISDAAANQNLSGMTFRVNWYRLQPSLALPYDFSWLDARIQLMIDSAENAGRPVPHFIPFLTFRSYAQGEYVCPGELLPQFNKYTDPGWVTQTPAALPPYAALSQPSEGGWVTYIWDEGGGGFGDLGGGVDLTGGVKKLYIDAQKALIDYYSNHPTFGEYFEGIQFQETAIGVPVDAGAWPGGASWGAGTLNTNLDPSTFPGGTLTNGIGDSVPAQGVPSPMLVKDGDEANADENKRGDYMFADSIIDMLVNELLPYAFPRRVIGFLNFMPGGWDSENTKALISSACAAYNTSVGENQFILGGPDIIPGDSSLNKNRSLYSLMRYHWDNDDDIGLMISHQNNSFIFWDNYKPNNGKHRGYPGPDDLKAGIAPGGTAASPDAEKPRFAWTPLQMFEYAIYDLNVTYYTVNTYSGKSKPSTWEYPAGANLDEVDGTYVYDYNQAENSTSNRINKSIDYVHSVQAVIPSWAITQNVFRDPTNFASAEWLKEGIATPIRTEVFADNDRDSNGYPSNDAATSDVAPYYENEGWKIIEDGNTSRHRIYQTITNAELNAAGITVGTTGYMVIKAKAGTRNFLWVEWGYWSGGANNFYNTRYDLDTCLKAGGFTGGNVTREDCWSLHTYVEQNRARPQEGWCHIIVEIPRGTSDDVVISFKAATGASGGNDTYQGVNGDVAMYLSRPLLCKKRY